MSNPPRVLVTGGAGYIGSHACKALSQAGFEPVTIDNLSRGFKEAVKWGPLEVADVGDEEHLQAIVEKYKPRAAMHFAAFAYVGESVENPPLYYRNNVGGSRSLIKALQAGGNLPLVFSSTCAVYGEPNQVPISETAIKDPINPYGRTKLLVEQMLMEAESATGLRSVSLRYFNAAGADPDGEIGESHNPETHLIPLALEAAAGARPPLQVFGTDYPTPDGTAVRDYIHVADLAEAHVQALNYLLDGRPRTALNLGSEKGFSVREVLHSVERVTGRPVPAADIERRAGDPPRLVANSDRARSVIGFNPHRSADLDHIIATAWVWMQQQMKADKALELATASHQ